MNAKTQYNIGDTVWIAGVSRGNARLTKGTVIKTFDLSDCGFNGEPHYLIKIETEIEPLLEVRTWHTISESANGPVGSLRMIGKIDATFKFVEQVGFQYMEDKDPDEPTPEQIHAAMERSQKDSTHAPFNATEARPRAKYRPRKRKV
jgi:hypothetical protein